MYLKPFECQVFWTTLSFGSMLFICVGSLLIKYTPSGQVSFPFFLCQWFTNFAAHWNHQGNFENSPSYQLRQNVSGWNLVSANFQDPWEIPVYSNGRIVSGRFRCDNQAEELSDKGISGGKVYSNWHWRKQRKNEMKRQGFNGRWSWRNGGGGWEWYPLVVLIHGKKCSSFSPSVNTWLGINVKIVSLVELCPPKLICWRLTSRYLGMWLYLKTGSLKRWLS